MYPCVTVSENMSLRVTVCLVYLASRDQRHFLVLRPNPCRGKIEVTGTSRGGEAGLWPFLIFILLETQPAAPQGNTVGEWEEQEGVCLCVHFFYYVHMCSREYLRVS